MIKTTSAKTFDLDAADKVNELSAKLAGLLAMLSGDGSERLGNLCDDYRNAVLWLASDMASDLKHAVDSLNL